MFFGQIERECLDPELRSLSYQTQLPEHLQLLVDQQQGKPDIWEDQRIQELSHKPSISVWNSKFISKCLLWKDTLQAHFVSDTLRKRKIKNSKSS